MAHQLPSWGGFTLEDPSEMELLTIQESSNADAADGTAKVDVLFIKYGVRLQWKFRGWTFVNNLRTLLASQGHIPKTLVLPDADITMRDVIVRPLEVNARRSRYLQGKNAWRYDVEITFVEATAS